MTGLILAGGRAVRFGGGKCEALLAGKPLICWVFEIFQKLCEEIWLSIRKEQLKEFGLNFDRIIFDENPGAGPAQAVLGAFKKLPSRSNFLLVSSCDQPLLQEELLKNLIINSRKEFKAVFFQDETGRLLPFPGVYHKTLTKEKDICSFKDIAALKGCWIIPPDIWRKWDPDGLSFYNINHREDLTKLEDYLKTSQKSQDETSA